MWLSLAAKRERNISSIISRRFRHHVAVQLDYYMSHQFAGVAWALVHDRYKKDSLDLEFLPTCGVGLEQERVRQFQQTNPTSTVVGSVEQNIFIPTLERNPSLQTTAVAAMFRTSPLCVVSLKQENKHGTTTPLTIGAHADTVELLQRLFPQHEVIASPRSSKVSDLMNGTVDAIQAYTTTEVATLEKAMQQSLRVTPLEGLDGRAKLGYSQVLFATNECLQDDDRRSVVKSFLQHTFDGWKESIRHPEEALRAVREAQKLLQLDDEHNDHWHSMADISILRNCNESVKPTFHGDRYGVILQRRWNEACQWLLADEKIGGRLPSNSGLDDSLWQPSQNLMAGNELAYRILAKAKTSALRFAQEHGRQPSLAVVTVGELSRYHSSDRRLQMYGDQGSSWFSKTGTGAANGVRVEGIYLDPSTTTEDLLGHIYKLRSSFDGIQLMWPLPGHIDASKVYNAIGLDIDVDGMHYVGQCEIGNKDAFPPVTPAAAMVLIDEYGVEITGKRVVVVGRSPIVGSPLAHMLRDRGGTVTIVHSETPLESLKKLVAEADVLVMCVGKPNLIPSDWIANDAIVLQVGTTFEKGQLVSDISGDLGDRKYSPVPGGIGPLSNAILFENAVKAAWSRAEKMSGWTRVPDSLRKSYHFDSYNAALDAAHRVNKASGFMDHHANMTFSHKCVDGVDLEMEFFSFDANQVTDKDHAAASVVDHLVSPTVLEMDQFRYELDENAIAKYPANPRGSSKLLHVDAGGEVQHFDNFSSSVSELVDGCHIVFNESKVADARLFLKSHESSQKLELMLLDLGNVAISTTCHATPLQAMIRLNNVDVGQKFEGLDGKFSVVVNEVVGIWKEDENSNGNGTEVSVLIQSPLSVTSFLDQHGSVPIPPYLNREAEEGDSAAYNNCYAETTGSVAAPTAGLHFTPDLLQEIGSDRISYLTLHVGAGTFQPVMTKSARDHAMHAETFSVSVHEIKRITKAIQQGKPLVVVGTTSCRTLETLYWCGVKKLLGCEDSQQDGALELGQFDWMALGVRVNGETISAAAALESLIDAKNDADAVYGRTSLMIAPPLYKFQTVDRLVTNFHAPDSTLMLLVSAFMGTETIQRIYADAQKHNFRFLSYGDACLFSKPSVK